MNKQLLASTALIAAGVLMAAPQASAAGKVVKLGLHGYMEQIVGVVFDRGDSEQSAVTNSVTGLDQMTEAEIHFKGSGKLDNGISIIVDVQLEVTGSPGAIIDEQYMIIRGGFGSLTLGSEDNAGHLMTIGYSGSWATGVGQSSTFDVSDWIALPVGFNAGGRHDGTLNNVTLKSGDNDSSKITYFTPRFSGFQVGVSYIPNLVQQTSTGEGGAVAVKTDVYHEGWSLGANYNGKFGKTAIGIAAGYLTAESAGTNGANTTATYKDTMDYQAYSIAAKVTVGPIKVAAAYKRNVDLFNGVTKDTATTRSLSGSMYDIGAKYTMGPNAFSLSYRSGSMDAEIGSGTEDEQALMASYARTLGAGIKWTANLMYADYQDDVNRNSTTVKGKTSGWAATTTIKVSF